jgi:hypothetical protein
MTVSRIIVISALLALGGCRSSSSSSAGPESSAGTSRATAPAGGDNVDKPSGTELQPFKVGQWTKYRVTTDKNEVFEITYKIVAEEDGAQWLEIVRGAADAGTVMQLLIAVKNRSDPGSLDLRAAKIRMPNGHVREIRGKMLEPTAEGYKKTLADIFVPNLAGATQEDVTVPAGTFHGCYKRQQKVEGSRASSEQTVWIHPSIPISGLVRSEDNSDHTRTELVVYGQSGAKSELVKEKRASE